MSRHDRILLISLCFLAALAWLIQVNWFSTEQNTKDLALKVSAPAPTPLDDLSWQELRRAGEERSWLIQGAAGMLKVNYVPDQGIAIVESSCPDQICVRTGYINKAGQSVVCVPNQVMLGLLSDQGKGDVDAILR